MWLEIFRRLQRKANDRQGLECFIVQMTMKNSHKLLIFQRTMFSKF